MNWKDKGRWLVTITYKTECGACDVSHTVEELDEIAELVERGPDWNAIENIVIELARKAHGETITVEKSLTL